MNMINVEIDCFSTWREVSRELLKREISPDRISWSNESQAALDFCAKEDFFDIPVIHKILSISLDFIRLAQDVACFRNDEKWSLLYSVAWRLMFEDRNLLAFKLDPQVKKLFSMRKTIGRDRHKMEAFLRFKKIENRERMESISPYQEFNSMSGMNGEEIFFAWFEPEHLILTSVIPFFVGRFKNMKWSILTPDACAHWNLSNITYSSGIPKASLDKDKVEDLWLEYYANIFNPARLKLKAMQSEMPKKYWANLPEAPLIPELTRKAHQSMTSMIEKQPTDSWSKTARSRFIREAQHALHTKSSVADLNRSK